MGEKRYYWLKLKEDFFEEKYIKALRKMPGGNEMLIVYLKMQLKSLKTEGIISYEKVMPSAVEELALMLDEDVNTVKATLIALETMKIVEFWDNDIIYMAALQELIGSETSVAARVRKHRDTQKTLQCNNQVTIGNTEREIRVKDIDIDINKDIKSNTNRQLTVASDNKLSHELLQKIVNEWNSNPYLSKITKISTQSKRYKMLKARITDYGADEVLRAIHNISQSAFLQGINKNGWIITFDWLVKPNNFPKVLENQYVTGKKVVVEHGEGSNNRDHDTEAIDRYLTEQGITIEELERRNENIDF